MAGKNEFAIQGMESIVTAKSGPAPQQGRVRPKSAQKPAANPPANRRLDSKTQTQRAGQPQPETVANGQTTEARRDEARQPLRKPGKTA